MNRRQCPSAAANTAWCGMAVLPPCVLQAIGLQTAAFGNVLGKVGAATP
jgi:hypothetical protein